MVGLGKKVLATAAVMLLVHVQIAWACADMAAMERSDCCAEHASSCDSAPPADGLCMEPLAGSMTSALPQPTADNGADGMGSSSADSHAFSSIAFAIGRPSTGPPRAAPDYRTSRSAQLTYLTTLRFRV
jgi:hypothetical protein